MNNLKKLFALLLAVVMLAGCTTDISEILGNAEPVEPYVEEPVDHEACAVDWNDIEYTRPDADAFITYTEELIGSIKTYKKAADLQDEIDNNWLPKYYDYYTMSSIASIHADTDTTDEYWAAEEEFFTEKDSEVDALYDKLLQACANSKFAKALEPYFGEGYIEEYAETVTTEEAYIALTSREDALVQEYHDISDTSTIEWNGEERDFEEVMEEVIDAYYAAASTKAQNKAYKDYMKVLKLYYTKYSELLGQNYIELMKVRKEIAAYEGYDSYIDYAFEKNWERDYTPEDADILCAEIVEKLVPIYEKTDSEIAYALENVDASYEQLIKFGETYSALKGGKMEETWNFMQKYHLMDLTQSKNKRPSSYTTYLWNYEMPYVLVNANGDAGDILTMIHEFGHAVDFYKNDGYSAQLEIAETFSQGNEMLFLLSLDESSGLNINKLTAYKMYDALGTFIQQASFHEFERRAYEIPEEELTVDALCDLYLEITQKYGYCEKGYEFVYRASWVEIPHLFLYPYYVVSYVVSNEVAMQIYVLEKETPDAGMNAYWALMDVTDEAFLAALEKVEGLESPFRDGGLDKTAALIEAALN